MSVQLKKITLGLSAALFTLYSQADTLEKQTQAYQQYVGEQIEQLLEHTETFVDALQAGDLEQAKAIYPHARMYYERSEPIAESFGDLDPRIDARLVDILVDEEIVEIPDDASAATLIEAMQSVPAEQLQSALDEWSGFHKIERLLWQENTTDGTDEIGAQLLLDIKELHAKIPTAEVSPEIMITGAVDLLNEVSTSKITGEENIFSGTDLFDFQANIEGAEQIFILFRPHIEAKDQALAQEIDAQFSAVKTLLQKHNRAPEGEYDFISYNELSDADIRELAEAVNKLGEPLAQMAIILE